MKRLLVVGGASFDVLHLVDRTVECVGGAGMYTAMAASRCGAQTTLAGPWPDPCPEPFQPVARRLAAWLGPAVSPEQLPRFEISYRQGKTEYLKVSLGVEETLTPSTLPADLSPYDHVHVTPLAGASNQLAFVQACRQRGAKKISAGTYPADAAGEPQAVRAIIQQTDYFFMNQREATAVFGSLESAHTEPGKLLYVTLGAQGVCIIQGETATFIPAVSAAQIDPTGAGDTFCGATLAYLLQRRHPIMAARRAAALAAEMIGQAGPAALLSDDPPPEAASDPRVRPNPEQLRQVARAISTITEAAHYPFVSPELPAVGHPQALDYFFAATLHQFSFWTTRNSRYERPLIAGLGGRELKGSDYLWQAFTRQLQRDPTFCAPERRAKLTRQELLAHFRADDGQDPMPALDLHLEQARQYGRDMLALQLTPQAIVAKALASPRPLQSFMNILDHVGGYKEDPLRKKSSLLAMILNQRPESFLPLTGDEDLEPIIDYHAQRTCLRVGLIEVIDQQLRDKLLNRQVVLPDEEWAVRYPAYRAVAQVVALSGKSTGDVDIYFFNARQRCPEMSEPDCPRCQLDPVCAHHKGLFQPVLRTTFY